MTLSYNHITGITLIVLGLCVLLWGLKGRLRERRRKIPAKYKNYAAVIKVGLMESLARILGVGLIVIGAAIWIIL